MRVLDSTIPNAKDAEPPPPTQRQGDTGPYVRVIQAVLTKKGFDPGPVNATFNLKTKQAVIAFQHSQSLNADGIVGPQTWAALGADGTARLTQYPTGVGLTTGVITVRGHKYLFTSGSTRLYSVPRGRYLVTVHRNERYDSGYVRDGVGFSFKISDYKRPGSGKMYDSRARRDRTLLRIHPDGGSAGTAGCIGLLGDGAAMRQFRADMNAEISRLGGSYMLCVV